jgi:hypothetical protein
VSSTVAEVKTISATVNAVGIAQTGSITIAPAAASTLVFAVPPSSSGAGVPITPPIQVVARDAFGTTATAFTGDVTMGFGVNPSGGTISGTNPVTAVNGVAAFTNLSLDKAGTGYTLVASGTGLSTGPSVPFNIISGGISAAHSTVTTAPAVITANTGATTATITVRALDAFDNPIQGATVLLTATGAGNSLIQPSGTTSANGVVTGALSSIVAEAKVVSAAIGGVTLTQTATVTVSAAVAASLAFTVQPTNAVAGAAITPAVRVMARDQFGNTATSFTDFVSVVIGTNPTGGTLSGTLSRAAVAGVATFTDLRIDNAGTGYTLQVARCTGGGEFATFSITAELSPPRALVSAAPGTITASTGSSATTITVTARDAFDNPIQGAAVALSSTGTNNSISQPGATNASGVTTGTMSSTRAESKTVSATIGGVLVTQTAGVTVNPAGVSTTQSTVGASPSTIEAGNGANPSTVTVTVRDGFGNAIQGATVILPRPAPATPSLRRDPHRECERVATTAFSRPSLRRRPCRPRSMGHRARQASPSSSFPVKYPPRGLR